MLLRNHRENPPTMRVCADTSSRLTGQVAAAPIRMTGQHQSSISLKCVPTSLVRSNLVGVVHTSCSDAGGIRLHAQPSYQRRLGDEAQRHECHLSGGRGID